MFHNQESSTVDISSIMKEYHAVYPTLLGYTHKLPYAQSNDKEFERLSRECSQIYGAIKSRLESATDIKSQAMLKQLFEKSSEKNQIQRLINVFDRPYMNYRASLLKTCKHEEQLDSPMQLPAARDISDIYSSEEDGSQESDEIDEQLLLSQYKSELFKLFCGGNDKESKLALKIPDDADQQAKILSHIYDDVIQCSVDFIISQMNTGADVAQDKGKFYIKTSNALSDKLKTLGITNRYINKIWNEAREKANIHILCESYLLSLRKLFKHDEAKIDGRNPLLSSLPTEDQDAIVDYLKENLSSVITQYIATHRKKVGMQVECQATKRAVAKMESIGMMKEHIQRFLPCINKARVFNEGLFYKSPEWPSTSVHQSKIVGTLRRGR